MNNLLLLNLINDLIKTDKPTIEEIKCARTVLQSLIKEYTVNDMPTASEINSNLSPEAQQAMRELQ